MKSEKFFSFYILKLDTFWAGKWSARCRKKYSYSHFKKPPRRCHERKAEKFFSCCLILSWERRRKSCSRIELMAFGVVGGLECFCMEMWMGRTIRKFIIGLIWIISSFVWIGKNESIPAVRLKWSEGKFWKLKEERLHTFMREFFKAIDNRTLLFYDDGRI